MTNDCICSNVPRIWRLAGVTRTVRLTVTKDGSPYDFTGLQTVLRIDRDNSDFHYEPQFTVEGDDNNIIVFTWAADKQPLGDYTIEVTVTDGSGNKDRVNWHGATGVRLVEYSNLVKGEDAAGVESDSELGLDGIFTMNGVGMGAYEEWLADGHEGSLHDYILWMQGPAREAAEVAEAQMAVIQSRADDDHTTAGSDHTRAAADHTTATGDHTRAEEDHTRAISDHTRAAQDHTSAVGDHMTAGQDHLRAEADHTTAGSDHTRAESDHATAASDHSTAASDHTKAGQDSTRAGSDHDIAVADHAQAEADHTRAESDHTTAAADHTTAASDHTTASSDHTTAAADHTQAVADHAVMAGYDTRLTNVETDVTQLGQKVDDLGDTLQDEIDAITPIVIEGDVTNAPDQEDITTDSNNLLKFKDRVAGVGEMGYKILRKDATFASQVTDANTIYEIRYPFNLNGASITILSGCVLKFNGGTVSNGTLNLNGCVIVADPVQIFENSITISGDSKTLGFFAEWFGAVGNGITDDTDAFQKLNGRPITLLGKTYIISNVVFGEGTSLIGSNIKTSVIKQKDNATGTLLMMKDWNGGIITNLSVVGGAGHVEKSNAYKIAGYVCSDALIKIVGTQYQGEGVGLSYYSSIKNVRVTDAPCNGIVALARVTDEGVSLSYNWVFSIDGIWVMHSKYYGVALANASDNRFSNGYLHHSGYANLFDQGSTNIWENFKMDGISGDGLNHELIVNGDEENSVSSLLNSNYMGALMISRASLSQYRNFDLQSGAIVGLKIIGTQNAQIVNSQFYGSISNCGISPNLSPALRIKYCPAVNLVYISNCTIDAVLSPDTSQKRDLIYSGSIKASRIRLQSRRYNQDYVNKLDYTGDVLALAGDNDVFVPDLSNGNNTLEGILHNLFTNTTLSAHSSIYTNGQWDNSDPIFTGYDNLKMDLSGGTTLYASSPWGTGASKKGHLYLAIAVMKVLQKSTKALNNTRYLNYPYITLNAVTSMDDQTTWAPTIAERSGDSSLLEVGGLFMSAGVFKFNNSAMPDNFLGQFAVNTDTENCDGIYLLTNFVLYDLTEDLGITQLSTSVERLVYNLMRKSGAWNLSTPLGDIHASVVNPMIQPAPGAFLDKDSLQNFLQTLGAAMGGGTWSAAFDPNTGKYSFDFRYNLLPTWTNYKAIIGYGTNVGNEYDITNFAASAAINIQQHAGKVLTYTRPMLVSSTAEAGMAFYDENNAAISGERVGLNQSENHYELTQIQIPANAVSVRFTTRIDMKSGFEAYIRP